MRKLSYAVESPKNHVEDNETRLTTDQNLAYDLVMQNMIEKQVDMFFIDAPVGPVEKVDQLKNLREASKMLKNGLEENKSYYSAKDPANIFVFLQKVDLIPTLLSDIYLTEEDRCNHSMTWHNGKASQVA